MHTLKVIFAGLALLAAFVLLGRWLAHGAGGGSRAALYFVGVWLLLAIANLMVGVLAAGYGMREELPIFVVVFAVPAVIALILRRALMAG